MESILKLITELVNFIHDIFIYISDVLGLNFSDKQLHFWIIGFIGIVAFFITDIVFHKMAKWNISSISFIYTFTVLIVFVFGLEIEQKITGRGVMDFRDILFGLWGFIAMFIVYLCIRIPIYYISRLVNNRKDK